MVRIRLKKSERILKGQIYDLAEGQSQQVKLSIYRWNPEDSQNPRLDRFVFNRQNAGNMVLDSLIKAKAEADSSLAFRRSCREGICGSCSMNINGKNQLACITPLSSLPERFSIYPLPHLPVIKDLVTDMSRFYQQYASIEPWIKNDHAPAAGKERTQSIAQRARYGKAVECILCACCSTSCPSYWWNSERFLGPATLLAAYRWIADSRDQAQAQRLESLQDAFKVYRCHTIMNCTNACPKNLNPAKAIAEIKKMLVRPPSINTVTVNPQPDKKAQPLGS